MPEAFDFPSILANIVEEKQIEPVLDYKIGVKTRWFWGEVDLLLMILLKKNGVLNLPPDYDGKLLFTLKFLKMWGKNLHYEVLSLRDIKPWIYETAHWFKS